LPRSNRICQFLAVPLRFPCRLHFAILSNLKPAEQLHSWFEAEPWRTSRELFERLQVEQPGTYGDGQLRTLQRRLKGWRREVTHRMVFGPTAASEMTQDDATTGAAP
jgi:hypothetical protein